MWPGRLGFDRGFFELMLVYCWTWHQFLLRAGWDSWLMCHISHTGIQARTDSTILWLTPAILYGELEKFLSWSFYSDHRIPVTVWSHKVHTGNWSYTRMFHSCWTLMLCTKTGVFSLGWGAQLGKTNKLWDVTPEPEMELFHFLKLESRVSENPILCACIHQ